MIHSAGDRHVVTENALPAKPGATTRINSDGVKIIWSVHNETNVPVTICDRHGVKLQLPPAKTGQSDKGSVIFRLEISIAADVKFDARRIFNSTIKDDNLELLIDSLDSSARYTGQVKKAVVDFTVPLDKLRRNPTIYVHESDMLLSLKDIDNMPDHPYHKTRVAKKIIEDHMVSNVQKLRTIITIVSKHSTINDRYVNICGMVFRIPIETQTMLDDGVYVYYEDATCAGGAREVRYTLEEADQVLGLYQTEEEARLQGNKTLELEKEIQELKLTNAQLNEAYKRNKMERDTQAELDAMRREREALERKREFEEEEHRRKLEQMRRKDDYDEKAMSRKDFNDFLKALAAAVTGAVALTVAILKFTESKAQG